jgi:AbrB family looped-hinge helix DNA binding protein
MDVAMTKMSSRGQVVIPMEMRRNICEGEKLIIIKSDDHIIMKKASSLDKNFEDDIAFAKKTEEAYSRVKQGKGTKMEFGAFIEEARKW